MSFARFLAPTLLLALVLGVGAPAAAVAADADGAYPNKPLRFIVPVPPGAIPDRVARVLSDQLNKRWGQPAVVDAGSIPQVATTSPKSSSPCRPHYIAWCGR